MSEVEAARQTLTEATKASIEAIAVEVAAAVRFLALAVHEEMPEAKRIHLSQSDQGDWLWVDAVDETDADGGDDIPATLDNDLSWASSCIYTTNLGDMPTGLHLNEERSMKYNPIYYIDIEEALK